MSREIIEKTFAETGTIEQLSDAQMRQGYDFLGEEPPSFGQFNFVQKQVWLGLQYLLGRSDVHAGSISGKVNKEDGKGLTTNDFSDEYKNAVDSLSSGTVLEPQPIVSANLAILTGVYYTSGNVPTAEQYKVDVIATDTQIIQTATNGDGVVWSRSWDKSGTPSAWERQVIASDIAEMVQFSETFPANPVGGQVAIKDGASFKFDDGLVGTNNSVTIFDGWVRQFSGDVHSSWAGMLSTSANPAALLEMCIAAANYHKCNVVLEAGNYKAEKQVLLQPPCVVRGAGSDKVIWDVKALGFSPFTTPVKTESELSQSSDLLKGQSSHAIVNTLQAGDVIRFRSTQRFTRAFDAGAVIRAYYVDAEMFEIATATASALTFKDVSNLDFQLSTVYNVLAFTPTRGGGLFGITIKKDFDTTTSTSGLIVTHNIGFVHDDLVLQNFNNCGIQKIKSMAVNGGTTKIKGGSEALGLLYGVGYMDGSKYCRDAKLYGDGLRHVATSGGSGWGIPMYCGADFVTGINCKQQAIDAHANSLGMTYGTLVADNGISLAGINHKIDSVYQNGGSYCLSAEGSIGLVVKNFVGRNLTGGAYGAYKQINTTIDNLDLEFYRPSMSSSPFNGLMENMVVNNCRLSIPEIARATTRDAIVTAHGAMRNSINGAVNLTINNFVCEGFGYDMRVGTGLNIKTAKLINCGLRLVKADGTSIAAGSVIYYTQASRDSVIENVTIDITNTNAYFENLVAVTSNGAASMSNNNILRNVRVTSAAAAAFQRGIFCYTLPTVAAKKDRLIFDNVWIVSTANTLTNFNAITRDCDFA